MRVVVVDDDALALSALSGFIRHDEKLDLVGTATDGNSAIEQTRLLRPDVVVMDLHLNGKTSGIDAIHTLCHALEPPKVLALTAFDHDSYLRGAFQAGARGFLLKTDAHDQLTRAIHDVYAGKTTASSWATEKLVEHYVSPDESAETSAARQRIASLTARELEVARLIGKGNTYEEIAQKLFISPSTVKATVSTALPKVGAHSGAQLAVLVERARAT